MSSRSTYLEQDLVNILASMTFNIPRYPKHFYETGYKIESIERDFDVTQDSKVREIKFDLVLNNLDKNHSLTCECKSGATEPDQLKRYSKLKSDELVVVGGVSSNNPSLHTHDITIVFNEVNEDRVKEETENYDFTLLSVSNEPTKIKLSRGTFQDDDLAAYFDTPIDYPNLVYEVFKVGGQTPLFKYITLLAAELVSLSLVGQATFEVKDVAPGIVSSVPGLYPAGVGEQMRKDVENKIEQALLAGSNYELNEYFEWDKSLKAGVLKRIKPGCKPVNFKVFKEQAQIMAERMRKKEPPPAIYNRGKRPNVHPNQASLDLFPQGV